MSALKRPGKDVMHWVVIIMMYREPTEVQFHETEREANEAAEQAIDGMMQGDMLSVFVARVERQAP